MRFIFVISILVLGFSTLSIAADDFGARFMEAAPSAFEDPAEDSTATELSMEEAADMLQNIMPAAGDEQPFAQTDDIEVHQGPIYNEIGEPIIE